MVSSYKIIKSNSIKSSDDGFVIDTSYENVEVQASIDFDEEGVEEPVDNQKQLELRRDIDEYRNKVNAQIQADKKNILETARIEAQQETIAIKEVAYQEGYAQGYSRAINEAKKEAAVIKNSALDFLDKTKEYRDSYLRENKENIYNLAKNMSENIVNHLIDIEDENILNIIRPLLLEYIKEEDIVITSDGPGKEKLEKYRDKIEAICPTTRFIFLEDKSIEKNGFIIENKEQIADLQISVQLENMVKEISDSDE